MKVDFTKEKECWVAMMGEASRMEEESKPTRMLFHVTNDYYGDGVAPKDTCCTALFKLIFKLIFKPIYNQPRNNHKNPIRLWVKYVKCGF